MIVFIAVIDDNKENFSNLVVQLGDLGSNSTRKVYAMVVTDGYTVALIIVIICLKVCLYTVSMKDRYLHYDK